MSRLVYPTSRRTDMLMALLLVLSLVLSALEYTTADGSYGGETSLTDDDMEDFEMLPVVEMENPVAIITPQAEPQAAEIEVADIVEDADTMPEAMPEAIRDELETVGPPAEEMPTTTEGVGEGKATPLTTLTTDEPYPMRVVEQLPQFPGGQAFFIEWLTKRLKFPASAGRFVMNAQVVASFVINADGTPTELKIEQPVSPPFDNEVIRVLKQMPTWKPGMMNGKPCRTLIHLPVTFRR